MANNRRPTTSSHSLDVLRHHHIPSTSYIIITFPRRPTTSSHSLDVLRHHIPSTSYDIITFPRRPTTSHSLARCDGNYLVFMVLHFSGLCPG
ncbi:hypothetical protein ACOMHN_013594 [Nucella lapillus]